MHYCAADRILESCVSLSLGRHAVRRLIDPLQYSIDVRLDQKATGCRSAWLCSQIGHPGAAADDPCHGKKLYLALSISEVE